MGSGTRSQGPGTAGSAAPSGGYGYATHLPALIECVLATRGPVLEMGCGLWSTPVLAAVCGTARRALVTVEENPAWLDRVLQALGPRDELHQVLHRYDAEMIDGVDWSVVLIDHAKDRRQRDLLRLKDRAEWIVVHDACHPQTYGYDFGGFGHVKYHRALHPWTAVLGSREP